jgi:hypothetical protein
MLLPFRTKNQQSYDYDYKVIFFLYSGNFMKMKL